MFLLFSCVTLKFSIPLRRSIYRLVDWSVRNAFVFPRHPVSFHTTASAQFACDFSPAVYPALFFRIALFFAASFRSKMCVKKFFWETFSFAFNSLFFFFSFLFLIFFHFFHFFSVSARLFLSGSASFLVGKDFSWAVAGEAFLVSGDS